ncbi:MAG TPA: hypothetical protein VEC99_07460 [Clostridia bacterium]|nr:hypothetical protein [Clostridia bacterium]
MSFRIDEPVVLVGAAMLVLWLLSEWIMQLFGLSQPKADKRERLSWYGFMFCRIRIEEAALEIWFPGDYQRYQATTHKLIPRLW